MWKHCARRCSEICVAEQSLRWSLEAVTVFVQERLLAKQWALGLHDHDPFLAQRSICPNEGDLYPLGTDRRLAVRPRAIDERADSRRFVEWDCKFPIVRHVSGHLPGRHGQTACGPTHHLAGTRSSSPSQGAHRWTIRR